VAEYATITDNGSYIELPIKVRYTSRDNTYNTMIVCERVLIDMYHQGKRDKSPYRLYAPSDICEQHLLPNKTIERNFTATRKLEAPAEVGSSTQCKVFDIGSAWIHGVSKPRKLKHKKSKVKIAIGNVLQAQTNGGHDGKKNRDYKF